MGRIRPFFKLSLFTFFAINLVATSVSAQQSPAATDGEEKSVRSAGDGARFRVLQRFSPEPLSALLPTVSASSPYASIIDTVKEENWAQAHQALSTAPLQKALNVDSEGAEADKAFLAAYVALQAGDHKRAQELFAGLTGKLPILDDYVHYFGAVSAHNAGDYHQAAIAASKVEEKSLLYPRSLTQLAESLIAAGTTSDLDRAVEILELYLALYPRRNDAAAVRMQLAETLEGQDKYGEAAKHYLTVWNQFPISAHATRARQRLNGLRPHLSTETQAQFDRESKARQVRRFNALFNIHRTEQLIAEIPDAIKDWKVGSAERCEGLFLVARSHTNQRKHGDGGPWYERVLEECKGSSFEIRALYLGGRGYWNAGNRTKAKELFERIWTEYPDHSFSDDAMYFTARILRDEGTPEDARALLRRQVQRYPDGDMAKDAHWLLLRELFENQQHKEVIAYVDGLKETGEDDIYSRGRLHYFRARAFELEGEKNAAKTAFEQVVTTYPKTYYAFLALNRLANLASPAGTTAFPADICALPIEACDALIANAGEASTATASASDEIEMPAAPAPIDIPMSLRKDQGFEKGILLLSLGLTSLAQSEFQALRARHSGSEETLWALSYLLDAARAYPLSHDIPRRHISNWMTGYPDLDNRLRWEVAFPTPFKDEVRRYARERSLPMALVYAIMREESGFNPRVESWANARGLLQLMEQTAANTARKDGLSNFSASQLFDPAVNIRLGTAYMAELHGQLGGHPALIVAGYNGGFGAVNRWLGERGELPLDLFVEDIPYGQTRNYTKRVLTSYWTYSLLYGEEKVPYLRFNMQ